MKQKVKDKLKKIIPQKLKQKQIASTPAHKHSTHEIERMADINVSKPLFAKRGSIRVQRTFAPQLKNEGVFLQENVNHKNKFEKSKIAKNQPLLQMESDSSEEDMEMPRNRLARGKQTLSLRDDSDSEDHIRKLIAPDQKEYITKLNSFLQDKETNQQAPITNTTPSQFIPSLNMKDE